MNQPKIDDFDLREERLHQRQMEFLRNCSPDDWHRYASNHNWDDRLDGLFWIVSQSECDKGTALLIFWKGEPTGYEYEIEEETMGDNIYDVAPMLRHIAERFNTTGYTRSEIAFDFLEATGHDSDSEYAPMIKAGRLRDFEELLDRQRDLADAKVKMHPDLMVLNSPGRRVGGHDDESDFYDLFPYVDDDGAEPDELAATSLPSRDSPTEGGPSDDTTPDIDASHRVREMRRQAGMRSEEDSGASDAPGLLTRLKRLFGL